MSRLCARSIARYGHSRRSTPSTVSSPSFCDAFFLFSFASDQTLRALYRRKTPNDWSLYEHGRRLSRNRAQRFARLSRKIARLDPLICLGAAGHLLIKSSDQIGLRSAIARVRLQRSNDSTRKPCEELQTASGIIRAILFPFNSSRYDVARFAIPRLNITDVSISRSLFNRLRAYPEITRCQFYIKSPLSRIESFLQRLVAASLTYELFK